jgi:hypothetical protein
MALAVRLGFTLARRDRFSIEANAAKPSESIDSKSVSHTRRVLSDSSQIEESSIFWKTLANIVTPEAELFGLGSE